MKAVQVWESDSGKYFEYSSDCIKQEQIDSLITLFPWMGSLTAVDIIGQTFRNIK